MDFSIMGAGGEATPSGGSLPTLLSFLNDSSGANALTFIATLAVLIGLNFIWELIVDVLEASLHLQPHLVAMVHKLFQAINY
jgi:hypothetical protein